MSARKVPFFGLLVALLILTGIGFAVAKRTAPKSAPCPAPKNDADGDDGPDPFTETRRQVQREIEREMDRATRIIEEGRERERAYPPVPFSSLGEW